MPKKAKNTKSETRQKTETLGVRVTHEEKAEIEAGATDAGLTIGSYVRATMLKKATTRPTKKPAADLVILGQILGQIGKIGNNLNQIAKRLNEGKGIGFERLYKELNELSIVKESILKALRREDDC